MITKNKHKQWRVKEWGILIETLYKHKQWKVKERGILKETLYKHKQWKVKEWGILIETLVFIGSILFLFLSFLYLLVHEPWN